MLACLHGYAGDLAALLDEAFGDLQDLLDALAE